MRSLLLLSFTAACLGGCGSQARQDRLMASNSRRVEEMRARAIDGRDVASERAAEIVVVDPTKAFDVGRAMHGSTRAFAAGGAPTSSFQFDQKVAPTGYRTRGFFGTKRSSYVDSKFATAPARTSGNYAIPNAGKRAETKTAPVNEAREANRTMASRSVYDADRQYLGQEATRMHTGVNPNQKDVGWQGHLQEMTIEDVRDLLNKNR